MKQLFLFLFSTTLWSLISFYLGYHIFECVAVPVLDWFIVWYFFFKIIDIETTFITLTLILIVVRPLVCCSWTGWLLFNVADAGLMYIWSRALWGWTCYRNVLQMLSDMLCDKGVQCLAQLLITIWKQVFQVQNQVNQTKELW